MALYWTINYRPSFSPMAQWVFQEAFPLLRGVVCVQPHRMDPVFQGDVRAAPRWHFAACSSIFYPDPSVFFFFEIPPGAKVF